MPLQRAYDDSAGCKDYSHQENQGVLSFGHREFFLCALSVNRFRPTTISTRMAQALSVIRPRPYRKPGPRDGLLEQSHGPSGVGACNLVYPRRFLLHLTGQIREQRVRPAGRPEHLIKPRRLNRPGPLVGLADHRLVRRPPRLTAARRASAEITGGGSSPDAKRRGPYRELS